MFRRAVVFHEHLQPFDKASVRDCQAPALVAATFARLGRTNALNMYASVHLAAVDVAEQAGHLVVNRRVRDSLTNNKALHDFYSVIGTTALNRRGEIWHAYGDGQLNSRHDAWARQPSLLDVTHTPYDPLKFRAGTVIASQRPPKWFSGIEMDFVF